MATMTAAELLDWLGNNLFLPSAQANELRPQLPGFADAHALAKELIKRNWLSPYQVNQILQGNGDSLIVGANRLLERIGEGSMGQVFKAWNTRLGRMVAVKMIHKEHVANTKAMERFRREMETASQLDHPNIVLVRDAGEAGDRPYMVMDYIDGMDLSQRVKQQGPLPLAEAVAYAHQAALGLQHAFERGVVHRDIKPGNLMLARSDSAQAPQVKILDFGLSRFESESRNASRLTHAGNLLGTVDYVAPEQAQDAHTADIRADIYGLGCTLYYLLTGQPPFAGSSVVEKITARTSGEPPSVRSLRPETPIGLDSVVQRLMARRPEQRYATPQEAAQALAPFMRLVAGEHETATLNQADLAAALAARKIPLAVPVTQPVPAGIAVAPAVLVGQPLPAHVVPVVQALPVLAAAEPGALPMAEAVPLDPWAKDAYAPPTTAASSPAPAALQFLKSNPKRALLVGLAVAVVPLVITIIALTRGSGTRSNGERRYGPGAELQIMPVTPMVIKEGRKTPVIVKIQRKDFVGPVRVFFEKLPDGFRSDEVTFKDNKDLDQLYLMVSFGSGVEKAELRLVAVAENLRDSTTLPVMIDAASKNRPIDDE